MRDALKQIGNKERGTYVGVVSRLGYKTGYNGHGKPTFLIINLTDINGNLVADHLWINYTKQFQSLGILATGDEVQFNARVSSYLKGYQGTDSTIRKKHPIQYDYKLEYPSKVRLLTKRKPQSVPETNWEFLQYILEENKDFYLKRAKNSQ